MDDEPSTRESSDPDYQRLWSMSFRELSAIEQDPDHPLHEKARDVGREIFAPFRSAIQSANSELAKQFNVGVGRWVKQAMGVSVTGLPNTVSPYMHPPTTIERTAHGELNVSGSAEPTVDIQADEAPDASAAKVGDAVQVVANQYLERLVDIQSSQLSHQRNEASKSGKREKVDRRIAWATLAVAVVTLITGVILGLPGFIENMTP